MAAFALQGSLAMDRNRLNTRRITSRAMLLGLLIAPLLALVPARTAAADHCDVFSQGGWSITINGSSDWRGDYGRARHERARWERERRERERLERERCRQQAEFDAGAKAGEIAGRRAGYFDGLKCRPFCADPKVDLCHESPFYIRGFEQAYARSYKCAFEEGEHERSHRHRHHH
jgi:hypothetical protein